MSNPLISIVAPTVVLAVGATLTLGGVFSGSALQLAAGVVMLVVALLGSDATRVSIRVRPASAELTLERRLPMPRRPGD